MAITVFSQVRFFLKSIFNGGGDYGPGPGVEGVNVDRPLATGTGDYQADRVAAMQDETLTASGNLDIDLTTMVGPDGAAVAIAEVVVLVIEAGDGNGDVLRITPSSSAGWTAFLGGTTPHFDLAAGGKVVLYAPKDGSYAVSGSNKSINIANQDSTATATYSVTVLGRSA